MNTVLITGSNGYIGTRAQYSLRKICCRVITHGHKSEENIFDILESHKIDYLLHLSANTKINSACEVSKEVEYFQSIVNRAIDRKIKVIYISTPRTTNDNKIHYKKVKVQCEEIVLKANGYILVPGLVYGGIRKGLFETINMRIRNGFLLPKFMPDIPIKITSIDDVIDTLNYIILQNPVERRFEFSNSVSSINEYLLKVYEYHGRGFYIVVPVFTWMIDFFVAIMPTITPGYVYMDKIWGLMHPKKFLVKNLDAQMEPVLSYNASRRRLIIREAKILFKYMYPELNSYRALVIYTRIIEREKDISFLCLPLSVMMFSRILLPIYEHYCILRGVSQTISWKLNAVSYIGEHTVLSGQNRYATYKILLLAELVELIYALAKELINIMIARLVNVLKRR